MRRSLRHRRAARRSRLWAWTLALSCSLGVGAGVAELATAGQARRTSAPRPQASAAHLAPDRLFTDLEAIRKEIERVGQEGIAKALPTPADAERFAARIGAQKEALVERFFDQSVYGIKASRVILLIDCMSSGLGSAHEVAENGGDVHASAARRQISKSLEAAKRCDEQLALALVSGDAKLPPGLTDDLATLRDELDAVIEHESGSGLNQQELKAALQRASLRVIALSGGVRFDAPAYGVALSILTLELSDIDKALAQAAVAAAQKSELVGYHLSYALLRVNNLRESLLRAEPPLLTPIHVRFNPAPPGRHCSPPYCTSLYTERASSPGGETLSYQWAVSIPADPNCATGFRPRDPTPAQASWYHADVTEGGPCNHQVYDAAGSGHPGTVVVVVSDYDWTCAATFYGTQGPQAQPAWDGPKPQACKPVEHH